jgi:hypothetical protein
LRHFQAFFSPDPLHPLVIDAPAFIKILTLNL